MRKRGATLIEAMVGLLVLGIVLAGIFGIFMAIEPARAFTAAMPTAQEDAEQTALTVAANIRKASLCGSSDSNCTLDAAVEATDPTGVTIYGRDSGGALTKTRYETTNGNFQRINSAGTTVLTTGAQITLNYYQSSTYHSNTISAYTPDSTTTPRLIAVKVTATVTRGNVGATYATTVRLRNSPKKLSTTD